ncbi:hypothetical protein FOMPIDRAFT_1124880 [Fomitopsis schrenkii]|uniref:Exonuclease domain-containing protein n=1 Tax=Fomitopsis schrenkii TaxID=2126942 RepID=S8E1R0_FOMSC|nr:hypothetical protein FOMPIDRAFT_1124880 [Fomitopsis schrenkii]
MDTHQSGSRQTAPLAVHPGLGVPHPRGLLAKVHPPRKRVVIVDYRGNVLLDSFVRPTQPVSDYRTSETGLLQNTLESAPTFIEVQRQVAMLLRDKIIIGYALWQFLSVMGLSHPAIDTRDVALFMPFRRSLRYRPNVMIPLTTLVNRFMGRHVGLHGDDPIEIARSTLDLFRSCEHIWEEVIETGAWPCALPPGASAGAFT